MTILYCIKIDAVQLEYTIKYNKIKLTLNYFLVLKVGISERIYFAKKQVPFKLRNKTRKKIHATYCYTWTRLKRKKISLKCSKPYQFGKLFLFL